MLERYGVGFLLDGQGGRRVLAEHRQQSLADAQAQDPVDDVGGDLVEPGAGGLDGDRLLRLAHGFLHGPCRHHANN